ncbi:MAG: ABC transporter substrate-binding protein [Anaerolineae bacterium]|nr:ABC transporter substrate-binding protein [Anaerolineae bacterium]
MFFRRIVMLLIVLTMLISPGMAQAQPEPHTLLMTFIPNIQFAPMYAAIGAGYFADAGIDLSLEYLNEPDVVDLVASGQYQFGVVSGEQIILAAAGNRPVIYVYEWFQQYPVGVVYDAALGIESASDLAGLRVGIAGRFGASYSGFTTLLESAEMVETDVQLEEIGFAAPEVFCVGAVDASVIYVNNEPLQIRNRAANGDCGEVADVDVLYVSDVVDLVANGIITNQDTAANQPQFVRDFVAAYDMGLRLTIQNPARAYLLSAPFVEGLPLDDALRDALETQATEQEAFLANNPSAEAIAAEHLAFREILGMNFDDETLLQFDVLLASIPLWSAERLGYSDLESWENMQTTLLNLELLSEPVDLSTIYTNEFLPDEE